MANVYDIGANDRPGGSLTDPVFLYTIMEPGVCNEPGNPLCNGNWHSATFSWDGEMIVLGWEPGGGLQAECEASDPAAKKSFFFYDADDGASSVSGRCHGRRVRTRTARSTTTTSSRCATAGT